MMLRGDTPEEPDDPEILQILWGYHNCKRGGPLICNSPALIDKILGDCGLLDEWELLIQLEAAYYAHEQAQQQAEELKNVASSRLKQRQSYG